MTSVEAVTANLGNLRPPSSSSSPPSNDPEAAAAASSPAAGATAAADRSPSGSSPSPRRSAAGSKSPSPSPRSPTARDAATSTAAAAMGEEGRNHAANGADSKNTWRCPDPGCKKSNAGSSQACSQCTLPRHSAHQFKRAHRGGGGGGGWGRGRARPSGGGGGWNRKGGGGGGSRSGGGGGNWRNRDDRHGHHSRERKLPADVDPDNPVVRMFAEHSRALDRKNDKHERIVKLARDVTIESKRVIFLLHRIMREDDKPTILGEAEEKLRYIRSRLWLPIAKELRGEDPYQFLRAYTGGLQEYVEAYSFYYYIFHGKLVEWEQIQKELSFYWYDNPVKRQSDSTPSGKTGKGEEDNASQDNESVSTVDLTDALKGAEEDPSAAGNDEKKEDAAKDGEADNEKKDEADGKNGEVDAAKADAKGAEKKEAVEEETDSSANTEPENEEQKSRQGEGKDGGDEKEEGGKADGEEGGSRNSRGVKTEIEVNVPKEEFILGLADLTGEVMRQAINMVGAGETEACFKLLQFLHEISQGFDNVNVVSRYHNKELRMKRNVLEQSLKKVENACFAIEVRGSEIPKSHLAGVFREPQHHDHGFADGGGGVDSASIFSE